MRARRREINIFNMSLLDILCGALGAFCFMMLVALPYYKPPGSEPELKKAQEETERLMHDLDQMKDRMRDAKSAEDMTELLERLKAQVKALQGQVNILTGERDELQRRVKQLTADKESLQRQVDQLGAEKQQLAQEKAQLSAENQALRAKNQELEEANKKLQALLQAKRPFTVVERAEDYGQGLDVMLFKPSLLEKSPSPIFQNWVNGQFDMMHTVRNAMLFGRGLGVTMNEDSPPNTEGKLFVRLTNPPDRRKSTEIEGAIVGDELRSRAHSPAQGDTLSGALLGSSRDSDDGSKQPAQLQGSDCGRARSRLAGANRSYATADSHPAADPVGCRTCRGGSGPKQAASNLSESHRASPPAVRSERQKRRRDSAVERRITQGASA